MLIKTSLSSYNNRLSGWSSHDSVSNVFDLPRHVLICKDTTCRCCQYMERAPLRLLDELDLLCSSNGLLPNVSPTRITVIGLHGLNVDFYIIIAVDVG